MPGDNKRYVGSEDQSKKNRNHRSVPCDQSLNTHFIHKNISSCSYPPPERDKLTGYNAFYYHPNQNVVQYQEPPHLNPFPNTSGLVNQMSGSHGVFINRQPIIHNHQPPYQTNMNTVSSGNSSNFQTVSVSAPKTPTLPSMKMFKISDLIDCPGRKIRPEKLVIIMRGLPGSGKSYVARIIRDREVAHHSSSVRLLSIDDYFNEYEEDQPSDAGKKPKYVYDKKMEDIYESSLLKAFNKTVESGLYNFVIVDAPNVTRSSVERYLYIARTKNFECFIAELIVPVEKCFKESVHKRTLSDIESLAQSWQKLIGKSNFLDVSDLLHGITEVEMEVL